MNNNHITPKSTAIPRLTIDDVTYRQLLNDFLLRIEDYLQNVADEQNHDIDFIRNGNILTIVLHNKTQLILNQHEPLHELWLASKQDGYHGYWTIEESWRDSRTQKLMWDIVVEQYLLQSSI
jgi:CyaY protein